MVMSAVRLVVGLAPSGSNFITVVVVYWFACLEES